eukprot:6382862-Amphidinium_carterae.3
MEHGMYSVSRYIRRGEDISIEFVPNVIDPVVKTMSEPNDNNPARQATMPFDIYAGVVTIGHSVALERVQCDHNAQYHQYVKHIQELVRTEQSVINSQQIPRGGWQDNQAA